MEDPLSFYELMRGLKALKDKDLVVFGSSHEHNTSIPKDKLKKDSICRVYTILSWQCRYGLITLQSVASTLTENGREAEAKKIVSLYQGKLIKWNESSVHM